MKTPLLWKLLLGAVLGAAAVGCAPKIEPEIASAASEPMYATGYPAELQRTMDRLNDIENKTKALAGKMSGYPDALKSPPFAKVAVIVDLADAEGRAYAYMEAREEYEATKAFYDQEKDEILKKVAGAAQYAAKQKGCDNVDVSGAAQHALKETIEKRLEKRFHDRSEAHVYIDRNEAALGKDNVEKLEEQADEIAEGSYLAHVRVYEMKVRLKRIIEEGEKVKLTLDASVRAEQTYQAESGRTAPEKKASEERAEAMRKASASVDSAVTQARSVIERVDERVLAITKTYDDAILKLREDLKKRSGQ